MEHDYRDVGGRVVPGATTELPRKPVVTEQGSMRVVREGTSRATTRKYNDKDVTGRQHYNDVVDSNAGTVATGAITASRIGIAVKMCECQGDTSPGRDEVESSMERRPSATHKDDVLRPTGM